MSSAPGRPSSKGPFLAENLREGDRYELSHGHPVYCAPTGASGARGTSYGVTALASDPDVESAGVDAGFSPERDMLRAPDVAIGNVPDHDGWIRGVPLLAVEYAGTGQDETELTQKIGEFLSRGTLFVWVVRLVGERRVEVHERGKATTTFRLGEELRAPGALRNPVRVEALFDRDAAHEATLRNLLQRKGYESLEQVRAQGREQGLEQGIEQGLEQGIEQGLEQGIEQGLEQGIELGRRRGLIESVRTLARVLDLPWTPARETQVNEASLEDLERIQAVLAETRRFPE